MTDDQMDAMIRDRAGKRPITLTAGITEEEESFTEWLTRERLNAPSVIRGRKVLGT